MPLSAPLAGTVLAATKTNSSLSGLLLPAILLVAVLLFFRASRRQRKNLARQQQQPLDVGREVLTTAGFYARVRGSEGTDVLLELAPGVVVRARRETVRQVLPVPDSDEARGTAPPPALGELPPPEVDGGSAGTVDGPEQPRS